MRFASHNMYHVPDTFVSAGALRAGCSAGPQYMLLGRGLAPPCTLTRPAETASLRRFGAWRYVLPNVRFVSIEGRLGGRGPKFATPINPASAEILMRASIHCMPL